MIIAEYVYRYQLTYHLIVTSSNEIFATANTMGAGTCWGGLQGGLGCNPPWKNNGGVLISKTPPAI